jgi:ectoine hydroxylase-related dioxygenase (phytanoyl-CoA dioxygenase family)
VSADSIGIPRGGAPAEACDAVYDARYYAEIRSAVDERGLAFEPCVPRRGDVLFWHSNLLHGARPCERPGATRKSLIAHDFGEGAELWSDLYDRGCVLPGLR